MATTGSSEPFVRGSDLRPLIIRAIRSLEQDFLCDPHPAGQQRELMTGYGSLTANIQTYLPSNLNSVQKIVRGILDEKRKWVVLTNADAIVVGCGSTMTAEQIPVFFQTRPTAIEAVETYEWVKDIKFKRYAKANLSRELMEMGKCVKEGRPFTASAIALEIVGGDPCPLNPQINYPIVGPMIVRRPIRSAPRTGGSTSRRSARQMVPA